MNFTDVEEITKEVLWPTRCAVCDEPGAVLCRKCRHELRYIDASFACPRCGAMGGRKQCSECNQIMLDAADLQAYPLDSFRSCTILNTASRKVITTYKDAFELRLAGDIANIMTRYVEPDWIRENALLTYIPATDEALLRRGFDHLEPIAKEISRRTGLKSECIFQNPKSIDQRLLGKKERIANMRQQFKLKPGVSLDPMRPILIIDDVSTTGATMICASLALKRAGIKTVYGLSFARVMN